uniref:Cytochrome b n=1 Tax=Trichinella nelsoni TaxID=6336 RepID=A0A0A0V0M3_9BILA|nr:cytochrome b [Trichinella nelsoni]AIW57014.1 cytochrome b [Trichinella nelsoni]
MMKSLMSKIPGAKNITQLPTPYTISYWWNLGSLLGTLTGIQIMTGLLLVMYFSTSESEAFNSIIILMREVKFGFLLRFMHLNGASFIFMTMYAHMFKGLMYSSFMLPSSWLTGNLILFLTILVAFMGYVIPWGNMSFWAATVITSFMSAIPILGESILYWIWGGYSITGRTLQFFFTLHYLLPFVISAIAMIHLLLLHSKGSSNPLGTHSHVLKTKFHPFFTNKDMMNIATLMIMGWLLISYPYWSSDPENFSHADRLSSPINIQPEWYFLPMYGFLRSSDSKLGGLILMISSILMFSVLPWWILQDLNHFKLWDMLLLMFLLTTFTTGWVASWSADAYYSTWLTFLIPTYFTWFTTTWMMAMTNHTLFNE